MLPYKIALLGATGSGKTQLASELTALLALSAQDCTGNPARVCEIDDHPPLHQALCAGLQAPGLAEAARRHASEYHITLLMGMDLKATSAATTSAAADNDLLDSAIRAQLASAGIAYQVIYGQNSQRTAHALHALASLHPCFAALAKAHTASAGKPSEAQIPCANAGWTWGCDTCSDPVCERHLFTQLLSQREAADRPSLQS